MGETVLVSFNRPPEVVSQRLDTVTLKAGNHDQQLSIKTRETQLGMAVEVTTAPQGPVMKAYSEGAYLMATKRSPSPPIAAIRRSTSSSAHVTREKFQFGSGGGTRTPDTRIMIPTETVRRRVYVVSIFGKMRKLVEAFGSRNGSGGGTRTPDTRIMIPLL